MTIEGLIKDFQLTAKLVAEKFYEKYQTKIPRQGSFGIIRSYAFHGCGLYAKLAESEIDFDFGDDNRVDGFDAWRLKAFADSKSKLYPMFNTEKIIQAELDKLERSNQIYKPGTYPGSSNYYWVTSVDI